MTEQKQSGDFDPKDYVLVIDTENYAENFEADMCAFVTGRVGEQDAGKEMATLFNEAMGYDDPATQNPFEDKVWAPADEHGRHRPVVAFPTPGWFCNDMGAEFRNDQEAEALADRNKQYEHERAVAGARMGQGVWDTSTPLVKHPALLSVAIFFNQQPTDDEIQTITLRAKQFADERPDIHGVVDDSGKITITGFRLLTETVTHTELKSWDVK